MSVYSFENASQKGDGHSREEIILDSLIAQLQFLEAASARHELWASRVKDDELKQAHLEIANLMKQTGKQFHRVLDYYRKPA